MSLFLADRDVFSLGRAGKWISWGYDNQKHL